jgi:hypothetical protein
LEISKIYLKNQHKTERSIKARTSRYPKSFQSQLKKELSDNQALECEAKERKSKKF